MKSKRPSEIDELRGESLINVSRPISVDTSKGVLAPTQIMHAVFPLRHRLRSIYARYVSSFASRCRNTFVPLKCHLIIRISSTNGALVHSAH